MRKPPSAQRVESSRGESSEELIKDLSDENGRRVFTKLGTKTKPKLKAKINSKRSRT